MRITRSNMDNNTHAVAVVYNIPPIDRLRSDDTLGQLCALQIDVP